MAKEEELTIAKFAEYIGVTRQAIYKAIKSGRISSSLTPDGKRVRKEAGRLEYFEMTDPSQQRKHHKAVLLEAKHSGELVDSKKDAPASAPPVNSDASGISFNEAKRKEMIIRAATREVELKQLMGKLVDKDNVYRELFNAGKELRVAIMAIPDRVIDDLLACLTRNEAHALLYKELSHTLEMLSDIENRKFGNA